MGSTDRYSPVRVSALLHLPESNARSFMIASALGNALDGDGTRNNLKSAKDATGVVISKKRREVILEVLVINPRRWRQLVDDWTDRYLAHRCSPGVVALFTKPLLTECPNCHRWIEGSAEAKPPMKSKPRGQPFGRNGTGTAAQTALVLPPGGAMTAAGAAQRVPFLGTDSEHPNRGVAMRAEEGMEKEVAGQKSSDSPWSSDSQALQQALSEDRRAAESEGVE